jgi:threonine/homoserine/homoserine lactone efflux protein
MQSSMTWRTMFALLGAMIVLAAVPSVSVLAVSARSATFGLWQGMLTAFGIVVGDIIFILIAIWGLTLLQATMGGLFFLIKYVGGIYLIVLGWRVWRTQVSEFKLEEVEHASGWSSFLTGLLITLGDQKATLFYLGFFPAFVDIETMSWMDTAIVIGIAVLAVGGVKLIYAFLANRARLLINKRLRKYLNRVAGGVMVIVGIFVMLKS